MSRSQSHARKLRKEWLRAGAYWYQFPTVRGTWRGGFVHRIENLPRQTFGGTLADNLAQSRQAELHMEAFRKAHPEIVQFWAEHE